MFPLDQYALLCQQKLNVINFGQTIRASLNLMQEWFLQNGRGVGMRDDVDQILLSYLHINCTQNMHYLFSIVAGKNQLIVFHSLRPVKRHLIVSIYNLDNCNPLCIISKVIGIDCTIDLTLIQLQQQFTYMYSRKSVDYAQQQSTIQTLEFSSFKRKTEQTVQLIIENQFTNQFLIRRGQNTLMCLMVIADLLANSRNKAKKNMKKVFAGFVIQNVPKSQFIYQHQNTLQQLLTVISCRCKSLNAIQDCLMNYTVTEFVLQCYGRKTIRNFIQNCRTSDQQLDLHGNQTEILLDYKTQLRGQILNFLALALNLDVSIRYKDTGSQLENAYNQYYGDPNSSIKIKIQDAGDFYKAFITLNQDISKLIPVSSSQNIYLNRKKQQQSLDTTIEGQSVNQTQCRSANKEASRCLKCKGKLCECDRNSRKEGGQKKVGSNNSSSTKSIFEGWGLTNGPKKQTSNHLIGLKPCSCGRLSCTCRK